MKKYLKLYFYYTAQFIKTRMEYNLDFMIGIASFIFTQGLGIIFLYFIFQNIISLNGWSFNEMLFLYGFAQLPRGLDHLITDNIWLLAGNKILRGDLDGYLIRPVNPLFQLIVERFQPEGLGELIIGTALTIYAGIALKLSLSPLDILVLIVAIITGSVIYTAIKLVFACIAFWTKRSIHILGLVYGFADFTKYPLGIFNKGFQIFLMYIVPFAFATYIPATYFIREKNYLQTVFIPIIVATIAFTIAYRIWLIGLKHYESAGN